MTFLFDRLGHWWRKKQRQQDLKFLWPIIKDCAKGNDQYLSPEHLNRARQAFLLHISNNSAWTKDYNYWQLYVGVSSLV